MKILSRSKRPPADVTGVIGVARAERDNAQLSKKLKKGDIAVIDHIDLDRVHAEALVERGVRAVINVSSSTSGRYPNLGPQILSHAGILLIDAVSPEIWSGFKSGDKIRIDAGVIYRGEQQIASGIELDDAKIAALLSSAQSGLSTQLESLAANSAEHLRREHKMLLEGSGVPRLRTTLRNRPAVVVSKAYEYEADLAEIKGYLKNHDAVLIGAGSGADALLDAGYTPDLVVGALSNLSDRALKECKEVVITSTSGQLTAIERLEKTGADAQTFVAAGSDEDLALVLADTNEASVIILAGGHTSLVDFLDRGPTDMSSTFLTRLRVGTRLVDAKAVAHFSQQRSRTWPILLLLAFALIAVGVAVAVTPVGDSWVTWTGHHLQDFFDWTRGLFT